jgi:hypothetical protein
MPAPGHGARPARRCNGNNPIITVRDERYCADIAACRLALTEGMVFHPVSGT